MSQGMTLFNTTLSKMLKPVLISAKAMDQGANLSYSWKMELSMVEGIEVDAGSRQKRPQMDTEWVRIQMEIFTILYQLLLHIIQEWCSSMLFMNLGLTVGGNLGTMLEEKEELLWLTNKSGISRQEEMGKAPMLKANSNNIH